MPPLASSPRPGWWLLPVFALAVFLIHSPYLGLPYFWDELGQFVPAALDLYHDGSLVSHSTPPNAHPPGVMAYLALVWRIFGYSISATRAAMLLLAGLAVVTAAFLALELCPLEFSRGLSPALVASLLLIADPLFYAQAMMAQLDMPAMLFTLVALLFFFQDRHALAAVASVALVFAKETGALVPLVLGLAVLLDPSRSKRAACYLAPLALLSVWFFVLWRATGHIFGDPAFTHYNVVYALHPLRAAFSLLRHFFYLFVEDFRWIASLAIIFAWRKTQIYSTRQWKIVWSFFAAHVVMVSVLGGAELERYLLPVLPLVYIAAATGLMAVRPLWRNTAIATAVAGLLTGLFFNPPFPFPYENNLAMADFVQLHRAAAQFAEMNYEGQTIYTAWPLTGALSNPAFGYVKKSLSVVETADLRYSTLQAIDAKSVSVLVLYSRTWEPTWGVLRWTAIQKFLSRYYQYERQMNSAEVRAHFALERVQRLTRRGQWVEIYAKPATDAWFRTPYPLNTVLSFKEN